MKSLYTPFSQHPRVALTRHPSLLQAPQRGLAAPLMLGDFSIYSALGAGSHTTTHLAERRSNSKRAIIKVAYDYLRAPRGDDEARGRFDAMCYSLRALRHPNLVSIFEIGETRSGAPAIAMAHIEGEELSDVLDAYAPLDLGTLERIIAQITSALSVVHAAGIVHGDIAAHNIIIQRERDGLPLRVVLLDAFDRVLDAFCEHPSLGYTGDSAYLAPERARGELTPASDMYSVGVLIAWICTGFRMTSNGGPLKPAGLYPDLPPELDRCVQRLTDPDPSRRPSASDFLETWREMFSSGAIPTKVTRSFPNTFPVDNTPPPPSFLLDEKTSRNLQFQRFDTGEVPILQLDPDTSDCPVVEADAEAPRLPPSGVGVYSQHRGSGL